MSESVLELHPDSLLDNETATALRVPALQMASQGALGTAAFAPAIPHHAPVSVEFDFIDNGEAPEREPPEVSEEMRLRMQCSLTHWMEEVYQI